MKSFGSWYTLNNTQQYVYTHTQDLENPIILYLHGGPGDATMPLVRAFNTPLIEKYTLVIWEQRGAGKSYYPFKDYDALTLDLLMSDMDCLVDSVLEKYPHNKVIIMAHSWGTVLGLNYIQQHPEKVQAYVGIGQVVAGIPMLDLGKKFILKHVKSESVYQKIYRTDTQFKGKTWLKELRYFMKHLIQSKGSLYQKKSYLSYYHYFLQCPEYSLRDCLRHFKGSKQGRRAFWNVVTGTDFRNIQHFDVPIIFFQGREDYITQYDIVYPFFEKLKSPAWFVDIESCAHFPQWTHASRFNAFILNIDWNAITEKKLFIYP